MGIDFLGNITNEQQVGGDHLVNEIVGDMTHGEVAYVETQSYWPDYDKKLWIDGCAPRFSAGDVQEIFEKGSEIQLVRCIRIRDLVANINGFIIDASSLEYGSNCTPLDRMDQRSGPILDEDFDDSDALPIIGFVETEKGVEDLTRALDKQFGIRLAKCVYKAALEDAKHSEEE
jgi:hypothetical protein